MRSNTRSSCPTAQIVNVFNHTLQYTTVPGSEDDHRAVNYVTANYPEVYIAQWAQTVNPTQLQFGSLTVLRSPNGYGGRRVVNVIFTYLNPANNVPTKFFTSIDVTGQFPYVVTPLQPYYER